MASFADIKAGLDEIAQRIRSNNSRMATAKQSTSQALSDLDAMPAAYTPLIQEIDAQAAANPTVEAWILAKSEKDLLVAEFNAAQVRATTMNDAIKDL